MNKFFKISVFTAALFSSVTTCFAASDGTLGVTSTGNSDITAVIQDLVMISEMDDLNLGTFSGSGTLTAFDDVCIFRNDSAGEYTVTATSVEGSFDLDNSGDSLAYSVFFNDVSGTNTGEASLTYSTTSATQNGANTSSNNCGGGTNARFRVFIANADLSVAPAGTYTGTLVLLVEPV